MAQRISTMTTQVRNLFRDFAAPPTGESFEELAKLGPVRIERIASSAEPEPVLYNQAHDEWVVLLQGRASLWIDGSILHLGPGDCLTIAAGAPHRVLETAADPHCLWLAVHVPNKCEPPTDAST